LANFDEVAVGVAHVAAQLDSSVGRWREELGAASAPFPIRGVDVGNSDVEETADAVGVLRGLEGDSGFVVSGSAADVDDDPAVGERDERGLARADGLAAEHVGVETARALDVVGDDEVGQHEPFFRDGEL